MCIKMDIFTFSNKSTLIGEVGYVNFNHFLIRFCVIFARIRLKQKKTTGRAYALPVVQIVHSQKIATTAPL